MTGTSSSKQSFFERVGEPPLDLGALRDPLSISPGSSGESGWSGNFISELSIRASRVSLYLLKLVAISDFSCALPIACLSTLFGRIVTIQFWRERGVSAQIFPRQVYSPVKQTFSIGSIVQQSFVTSLPFLSRWLKPNCAISQQQIRITQTHLLIFDCNSKYGTYNYYHFSTKRKK